MHDDAVVVQLDVTNSREPFQELVELMLNYYLNVSISCSGKFYQKKIERSKVHKAKSYTNDIRKYAANLL